MSHRFGNTLRRLGLLAGLLASAAPAWATMQARPVEWTIGDQTFSGHVVYDDASAIVRPGIVMVPNWMGVTDAAVATAKSIAGHDHVVLVADVYGKDVRPKDADEARAQVAAAFADGGTTLRKRVAEAVLALQAQAGQVPVDARRIGAVGFCFGGTAVLELARTGAPLAGVASFHAGLRTHLPTGSNKVVAPILVLNGAADTAVTDADITAFGAEMDAAGADWTFVDFSGARHCFAEPENADNPPDGNCLYEPRAATRAFRAMRDFFGEQFATH